MMPTVPNRGIEPMNDDLQSRAGTAITPLLWVAIFLYAVALILLVSPVVLEKLARSGITNPYNPLFGFILTNPGITSLTALVLFVLAGIANVAARSRLSKSEEHRDER
jgi:hypothetical protein